MNTLGVVGLGYVGLPLAVQAAEKGYIVTGVDLNRELVELINRRESPYVNDERFDQALARVSTGELKAMTAFDDLGRVRNIVICVPTPTDNNIPDLSLVIRATEQVAKYLRKGQLVSLESTVNPGVTRDVVLPILEKESRLKVGEDYYLVHCPERIDPGNKQFYVGNLNRVLGGITENCTKRGVAFYSSIIDAKVVPLNTAEEAEFVKSWENTHRNVMIALANNAAIICDALNMDISRILQGLQSKVDQFGLKLAQPGIGPGGHCIPEDIHYVIRRARESGIGTRFLEDAAELNDNMPRYAIHQLTRLVQNNNEQLRDLRVALLGLAYKPNIADTRRSPSIEVGHYLVRYAKSVVVHDPYVQTDTIVIKGAEVADDIKAALEGVDVVFIGTAHAEYLKMLTPQMLRKSNVRYVLDGRNILDKHAIVANGILYQGIGR